jgi:hypothetical protein
MVESRNWQVASSADFENQFRKLTKKDRPLAGIIKQAMEKVELDPLCGDSKTGLYHGCRAIHVGRHFVLGWYLEPTIVQRVHLGNLKRVVFFFIGHHDDWSR